MNMLMLTFLHMHRFGRYVFAEKSCCFSEQITTFTFHLHHDSAFCGGQKLLQAGRSKRFVIGRLRKRGGQENDLISLLMHQKS